MSPITSSRTKFHGEILGIRNLRRSWLFWFEFNWILNWSRNRTISYLVTILREGIGTQSLDLCLVFKKTFHTSSASTSVNELFTLKHVSYYTTFARPTLQNGAENVGKRGGKFVWSALLFQVIASQNKIKASPIGISWLAFACQASLQQPSQSRLTITQSPQVVHDVWKTVLKRDQKSISFHKLLLRW